MNVEDPIELLLTVHELLTRQTNEFATYGALALAAYGDRLLERVLEGELRGRRIRLVSPEDYVLLKLLSTRE